MIGRRNPPSTPEATGPKGFDDFDLRLGDLMRGERATLGKSLLDVQRELKIKATYIAAIENADVSAFETQGFIAGYVRSYARYLGMNPDWAYEKFCREANFTLAHGMSQAASPARITAVRNRAAEYRDPFADPNASFVPRAESFLNRVEPGAVGSLAVLVALIAGIGYGGWSVLQQVQQVQLAPVDQAPRVVAEIDPLGNVPGAAPAVRSAPAVAEVEAETAPEQIAATIALPDRTERPEALDVPVLVARDGPIAAINPKRDVLPVVAAATPAPEAPGTEVQVVSSVAPGVELLAVRPSWVRVKAADGTVLFEKILDAGERYVVPQMETPPLLRAGNSGSVYFAVNGKTYGPAAPGAQVVNNVALSPEALTAAYALADLTQDPDLTRYAANDGTAPVLPVPEVPQN
ncbi:MAG: helix-turn-helix domain-containing protein [Gemmobacter sp.]